MNLLGDQLHPIHHQLKLLHLHTSQSIKTQNYINTAKVMSHHHTDKTFKISSKHEREKNRQTLPVETKVCDYEFNSINQLSSPIRHPSDALSSIEMWNVKTNEPGFECGLFPYGYVGNSIKCFHMESNEGFIMKLLILAVVT